MVTKYVYTFSKKEMEGFRYSVYSNFGNLITIHHSYFLNFLLLYELQEMKLHHSRINNKFRLC